jgi:hypothetical protein
MTKSFLIRGRRFIHLSFLNIIDRPKPVVLWSIYLCGLLVDADMENVAKDFSAVSTGNLVRGCVGCINGFLAIPK